VVVVEFEWDFEKDFGKGFGKDFLQILMN